MRPSPSSSPKSLPLSTSCLRSKMALLTSSSSSEQKTLKAGGSSKTVVSFSFFIHPTSLESVLQRFSFGPTSSVTEKECSSITWDSLVIKSGISEPYKTIKVPIVPRKSRRVSDSWLVTPAWSKMELTQSVDTVVSRWTLGWTVPTKTASLRSSSSTSLVAVLESWSVPTSPDGSLSP